MKKLIAIAAVLASTQSFAFFNDGYNNNSFVQDGRGNATGNAKGNVGGSFGINFAADGDTDGSFLGNNRGVWDNSVRYVDAYDKDGNLIGKIQTGSSANGQGRTKGGMKFGMNFSGNASGDADVASKGDFNSNTANRVYGYDRPYYNFPAQPTK